MRDKSLLNKIYSSSFGNFPKNSIHLQILSHEIPIIWFHGVYLYMKQKHQKQHNRYTQKTNPRRSNELSQSKATEFNGRARDLRRRPVSSIKIGIE